MQHEHRREKSVPIRWGIVITGVLAVATVGCVAFAAWYVAVFALPAWRHARQDRAMEFAEVQLLSERVSQIEGFLKLPANQ